MGPCGPKSIVGQSKATAGHREGNTEGQPLLLLTLSQEGSEMYNEKANNGVAPDLSITEAKARIKGNIR
jgi:hypothetical protein